MTFINVFEILGSQNLILMVKFITHHLPCSFESINRYQTFLAEFGLISSFLQLVG